MFLNPSWRFYLPAHSGKVIYLFWSIILCVDKIFVSQKKNDNKNIAFSNIYLTDRLRGQIITPFVFICIQFLGKIDILFSPRIFAEAYLYEFFPGIYKIR